MSALPRVAVVGVGGLFPGAPSPEQLWHNILAGFDASSEPPLGRWVLPPEKARGGVAQADRVPSTRAYFLAPFVPDLTGLALEADFVARLDPLFQLALAAGATAWRSARMANTDRRRVGVILGAIALPTEKTTRLTRRVLGRTLAESLGRRLPPSEWPEPCNAHVTGLPAALLARALSLGGPAFTLDAACASTLYAVKLAIDELQAGRVDAMLAGGLSRPDSLYTQMGFAQLRAVSPSGRCSPFDSRADGLVVGEGAGVFVLKRLDDALRDGDRIRGVIAGVGLSNDVAGGLLAPASEGQLRAMRAAYSAAGWRPDEVELIECHATGTPVGDAVEYQSLRALWEGIDAPPGACVIGSVKSSVGHLLTGAGAAALTKVLFALDQGILPPTANFAAPLASLDLERSPFRVTARPEPWGRRGGRPRRVAVSGFGFGGVNAHLLAEEWLEGHHYHGPVMGPTVAVAVADADGWLGPWRDRAALEAGLLGVEAPPTPEPARWLGVRESAWFRRECGDRDYPGHYLEEVLLTADRFRVPPREVEEMLPQQIALLEVAGRVLSRANLSEEARLRTGVYVGVALDLNTTNYHLRWALLAEAPQQADAAGPPLTANRTMGALASIAASRVARAFRLGGPGFTLSAGECSGLAALHVAAEAIRRGEIDAALVGAVDLPGDVRAVLAREREVGRHVPCWDGAVALLLRRGDVAGGSVAVEGVTLSSSGSPDDAAEGLYAGASTGLVEALRGVFAIERRTRAGAAWLVDERERRGTTICSQARDGGMASLTLTERPSAAPAPGGWRRPEGLFVVEGASPVELVDGLEDLRRRVEGGPDDIDALARSLAPLATTGASGRAVTLVARDREQALELIGSARAHLLRSPDRAAAAGARDRLLRDRFFYSPSPLAAAGEVALVFPGSGNDFPGMGREMGVAWPEVLRRQERESLRLRSQYLPELFWDERGAATVRQRLFAQVALGTLVADILVDELQLRPAAAIGYSLGESSALFALRAWRDRDVMLGRMETSSLFTTDLTGRCDAARAAWGERPDVAIDWQTAIVHRRPEEVRAALANLDRCYLQIINALRECVVGGQRDQVHELARRLGCPLVAVPETTTMHCRVVAPVAEAYRDLHVLPATPPEGVRFYSAGLGRAYEVDSGSAADAVLAQALDTLDFPAVIEAAYRDGVRVFVEAGPGGSCSRMIGTILGDRPHLARSACGPGEDGLAAVYRVAAALVAERVPVSLAGLFGQGPVRREEVGRRVVVPVGGRGATPPPPPPPPKGEGEPEQSLPLASCSPLAGLAPPLLLGEGAVLLAPPLLLGEGAGGEGLPLALSPLHARADAHASYLHFANSLGDTSAAVIAFQGLLIDALLSGPALPPARPVALDRARCLEFAVGSIANVLGPDYAEIDAFPTRVRLPDEPLMLVDRILTVAGEPLSLTHGRVVTEHDVLPGAWYLDNDRAPTCIAVEAGQADLFLSAHLGIDLRTRGQAVYRLLDAVVTFHRSLPRAGETIRYDVHIDQFFRQDQTHLFRFRFEGTVGGEPLLTMIEGCAGFFTPAELAAGKGVVHTALQRRSLPGVVPADESFLPPVKVESYDEARVDALRRGDPAACFGPTFAGLALREPCRLPEGLMRLVHRVTHLDPAGGRFGVGMIRAEADIRPDDWFLTCHFVDDPVMPGTLMYECCLHTLRIFLMRLGWVGEHALLAWEPVPGVASRLKCRGQVTAATRTVTYEVVVKERGYRPEPYALVDALMYADGKPVVDITDMSVQLAGLTREGVEALWAKKNPSPPPPPRSGEGEQNQQAGSGAPASGSVLAPPLLLGEGAGGEGLLRPLYTRAHILAFATGKPSEAFGDRYRPFDEGRIIARLPAPPYSFLDRVIAIDAEPWKMAAGGTVVAEYDVPPEEWYFASERAAVMPFCVLLEAALQVCGWFSSYMGAALTSAGRLHYRNLGGDAELLRVVTPASGTLRTRVRCTRVAASAGMIIHEFDFEVSDNAGPVYRGVTQFGFFSPEALGQQVGLRDAGAAERGAGDGPFPFPEVAPFPDQMLRMIDRMERHDAGGPRGLGLLVGTKQVRPEEWFFAAHFYQDPVMPGSLGLEALLDLMKFEAVRRWAVGPGTRFEANVGKHRWAYRGQVIPTNREVTVQMALTACDDARRLLTADGLLWVDGLPIYRMTDFTVRAV